MHIKETTPPSSRKFNLEIDENELKILVGVFEHMNGEDLQKAVNRSRSDKVKSADVFNHNSYDFYVTLLNALKA
jgi:hypothetical protein